ncbi:two-component system response regulator [Kitasatospora sp. NPDC089913]|uniref:response regulator n=1 Tax=Kitasatospora sp. NPDC089913 TaxID=3364080 RepID=UPI003804BE3E
MSGLQPLGENLNSECRALAQALRELFSELAVSVRRCAARCYVDAGTLSRYLAGTRVPPADFMDDFLRHIEEVRGTRIEQAAREHLRALRVAAVRTNASIGQAVRQLEGQLKAADREVRRTGAREEELDHALDGCHHAIDDLDARLTRLEHPGGSAARRPEPVDEDRAAILEERNVLALQVARLGAELERTRRRAAFAEARCELLERQLEVVEQQQGAVLPEPELVRLVDPLDAPALVAGCRPKVLLVDDRRPNLMALEAVLHTHGHEVVSVSSGQEALKALLESDDFAVIILDVQMPGMDGYETAAHIKRRARTRDIPIIFLTAIGNDPEYSMRGYAAGAVDFIVKPFDPWALRAKVAVFVEIHLERREHALGRD